MLTRKEIDEFYTHVEGLGLKFPGAVIAASTGESKANVSKILARKKDPSESFLNRFYAKFPKSSKEVSADPGEGSAIMKLTEANLKMAEAMLIDAQNRERLTRSHEVLVKRVIETESYPEGNFLALSASISALRSLVIDQYPKSEHEKIRKTLESRASLILSKGNVEQAQKTKERNIHDGSGK